MVEQSDFGTLRALLHASPSQKAWEELCNWAELMVRQEPERLKEEWLPYAVEFLKRWPQSLCNAPESWLTPDVWTQVEREVLLRFARDRAAEFVRTRRQQDPPTDWNLERDWVISMEAPEFPVSRVIEEAHPGLIHVLTTVQGGKYVVTVSQSMYLRIWDGETGDFLSEYTIPGYTNHICSSIYPSGESARFLVLSHMSLDGRYEYAAIVFDAAQQEVILEKKGERPFEGGSISADGKYVTLSFNELMLIAVDEDEIVCKTSYAAYACLSPHSQNFWSMWGNSLERELLCTGVKKEMGHIESGEYFHVASSRRGDLILTGTFNNQVYLWNAHDGSLCCHIGVDADISAYSIYYFFPAYEQPRLCMSYLYTDTEETMHHIVIDGQNQRITGQAIVRGGSIDWSLAAFGVGDRKLFVSEENNILIFDCS